MQLSLLTRRAILAGAFVIVLPLTMAADCDGDGYDEETGAQVPVTIEYKYRGATEVLTYIKSGEDVVETPPSSPEGGVLVSIDPGHGAAVGVNGEDAYCQILKGSTILSEAGGPGSVNVACTVHQSEIW